MRFSLDDVELSFELGILIYTWSSGVFHPRNEHGRIAHHYMIKVRLIKVVYTITKNVQAIEGYLISEFIKFLKSALE